ncbi:hypothetical protein [Acetanaerobacterium elongatum]|uniref:STAS domain-containing protein n=1 Tax=Acetanaerobacterium elongatum TaxID=258515 RepID=A0A1H0G3J2_9FIRM|nr:hypothetical protein [Acetanaerobacterium elongatum]SDO01420.1 hypothetical protein SAMN05192585_1477 [Acetanaerobacterium elongatum]
MGSFKFATSAQTIDATVEGTFTPSDAEAFLAEYKKVVSKVNPAQTTLNITTTNLAVSSKEMQEILKGCIELYKSTGFKKVVMICGDNVIVKMQLQRLAKEANFNSMVCQ